MRNAIVAGVAAAMLVGGAVFGAASPTPEKFAYWLESGGATNVTAAPGATVTMSAYLSNQDFNVQGWSFGVCLGDAAVADVVTYASDAERDAAMLNGTGTATVNNGNRPGFMSISVLAGRGVTMGVVVDMMTVYFLPPSERFEMLRIVLSAQGEGVSEMMFCDTLGSPTVDSVIVVGGQSIKPATRNGATITVEQPSVSPTLAVTALDDTIRADMRQTGRVHVAIGLPEDAPVGFDMQGWSYGLAHDGALLHLLEITPGAAAAAANGGAGPDFYQVNINPAGGAGGTVGAVVKMSPPFSVIPVAPGQFQHTETFVYRSAVELSEANGDVPVATMIDMAHETLGSPPVAAVVVIEESGVDLTSQGPATVTLTPTSAEGVLRLFRRGDANNDGTVNIADGVFILSYAFRGGREPACLDAADANDDGVIDQTDAIVVIYYQLLGGEPPLPPFPGCGTDPSDTDSDNPEDGLGCAVDGAGCL